MNGPWYNKLKAFGLATVLGLTGCAAPKLRGTVNIESAFSSRSPRYAHDTNRRYEDPEYEEKKRNFYWDIETGAQTASWETSSSANIKYIDDFGDVATVPASVIYKTEGPKSYHVRTSFGIDNLDMLILSYEAPFQDTPKQRDMVEHSSSRRSGIEEFTGVFGLYPLLNEIIPDIMEKPLMRKLLSAKFSYSHRLFYGKLETNNTFRYIPKSTRVDLEHKMIYGGTVLKPGDALSFKTEFDEFEVDWNLYTIPLVREELRAGYFDSKWLKPSMATGFVTHDTGSKTRFPTLCDAQFDSSGISFRAQPSDETSAGFNLSAAVLIGLKNRLSVGMNDRQVELIGQTSNEYLNLRTEAWYNYYIGKDGKERMKFYNGEGNNGFFITPGLSAEKKRWIVRNLDVEDDEYLYKFYIKAGYRF